LGQRVAVLHAGVIQQIGTPPEIYEKPANRFVAGFVGRPSMNFIARQDCVIGVRPEHLEFCDLPEALAVTHIESVQYMGPYSDVQARYEDAEIVIRHFGSRRFAVGDTLALGARTEHLHRFDSKSGKRIES
jgi:ABC-type sugar transport system ATPase subunit